MAQAQLDCVVATLAQGSSETGPLIEPCLHKPDSKLTSTVQATVTLACGNCQIDRQQCTPSRFRREPLE